MATTKQDAGRLEEPRPVLIRRGTAEAVLANPERTGARLLFTLGGGLTLFELVRLGLLWYPLQLGIAAWEFGTVTETFDVIPLVGVGAALMTFGVVHRPDVRAGTIRTAAGAFASATLLLLLVGWLYLRSVPTVLAEALAEALEPLRRSLIETGTAIIVSVLVSLIAAVLLWRSIRKRLS